MKKPILKWKTRNRVIIVLAYAHRYLWPILMVLLPALAGKDYLLWMGICVCMYAVYTFIGYMLGWKHIYCSYQNAYHSKMMPEEDVYRDDIEKIDAYGVPIIFGILGMVCLVCHFLIMYA